MATFDSVNASLRMADDWQMKGQTAWAGKCISSALMGYLHIALTQQADAVTGIEWLRRENFSGILHRQLDALKTLQAEVSRGHLPNTVIAGNYHPLVYALAGWCLEESELGEWFVTFAESKEVGELGTPFWREFAAAVGAMVRRERYQVQESLRPRGQEKYWIAYLRLIEAACNDQSIESAVAEIDRRFGMRNSDNSIKDDAYQIEGSGAHPVRWDFRRQGLLSYIARRNSTQV